MPLGLTLFELFPYREKESGGGGAEEIVQLVTPCTSVRTCLTLRTYVKKLWRLV